jgi:hypothetical protein
LAVNKKSFVMDYSTDQAKSIFKLIEEVSIYAYPLLIGLIFPLFWILIKKLLGISTTNAQPVANNATGIRRFLKDIVSFFSLNGDTADKIVFYISLVLFIGGGFFLKIGEYNKEQIRQRALGLKQHFIQRGYLFFETDKLMAQTGYTKDELNTIAYNYPTEFIQTDKIYTCVDTAVQRKVYDFTFPLLQSYIKTQLKKSDTIYLDDLFQVDTIKNFKIYFSDDIKENFLSKNINNADYGLDIIDNKAVILKTK